MTARNAVTHCFFDIPMSWSHLSLCHCLSDNAKIDQLDPGDYALFINPAWSAFKLLASGNSFLYHRATGEGSVTVQTIQRITTTFGGQRLKFSSNLEMTLIKAYEDTFGKPAKVLMVS